MSTELMDRLGDSFGALGARAAWPEPLRTTLELVLGSSLPMFLVWGADGVFVYNESCIPLVGKVHPAACGAPLRMLEAAHWRRIAESVAEVCSGRPVELVHIEAVLATADGRSAAPYAVSLTPVRDAHGTIAGVFGACAETLPAHPRDRAAQERSTVKCGDVDPPIDPIDAIEPTGAETDLRASEARLRQIVESTLDVAIVTLDERGVITAWNRAAERVVGFTREEAIGQPAAIFFTAEDCAAAVPEQEMQRARTQERAIEERWHRRRDGSRFWGSGLMVHLDGAPGGYLKIFSDRTREHEAGARLHESESRLRAVIEAAPVGLVFADASGRITGGNARVEAIVGHPVLPSPNVDAYGEWIGFHPDGRRIAAHEYPLARVLVEGLDRAELEALYQRGDGRLTWIRFVASPVRDADGRLIGGVVASLDVDRERCSEAALRESEARLTRTLAMARLGTFEWELASDAVWLDARARELFGFAPDATVDAEAVFARIDPDDAVRVRSQVRTLIDSGARLESEYRVRPAGGGPRTVASLNDAIAGAGADGRTERIVGVLADVTDRRQAEELLRRSEERYRTLFEAVDVGFCVVEMMFDDALRPVDYRFVEANPAFERQTGMVGATGRWVSETAPGLEQHWYDTYGRVALTGVSERFENEAQPLDRWFDVYAFRTGAAHEHRVAILFTDITVRRRAEQHLRELNETLERRVAETSADLDRVWTNAGDIFVVLDAEGVFRRVNPATTAILGWSEAELIGRPVFDFVHPHDLALTGDALVQARGRALPMVENRYRTKDGRFRRIAWVTAPEGRWIYAYGRDVTEERERQAELEETQDALRQAQKMEAVGQLTGGIAHDFNNMLAVVMGSLDLLGRRFGAGDPRALRYIEAARDGARRAALLTQRLLAFARQQPLRPEAVDVKQLVLGMSGLIRGSLGSEIRFETEFADGGWRVHVDPNQLENALLNLAVNARDAMPEGGRMTIETRHVEHEPADAAAAARHPAGAWVRISVRDTGTGMSPEVIAKAFDPFFTTKAVGRGTGLGLSQVYGFVRQSGGQVEIHSAPGRGTTIDLQLPRFLGGPAPSAEASLSGGGLPLSRAQETILVVDDEPAVRQLSLDALGELGYRVLEADGAAAALQQLERHPEIALLFTDIVMPETNGRKLAEEARRLRPGLRVLFTTGYTSDAGVHQDALAPGVDLIGKPFSIAALAAKLRAVLAVRKFGSPEPE